MPIDKAWLAQIKEETLEPELPICDPHHHLWDHPESRYLLADLLDDTESGHNIVSTVFVECLSKYQKNSSVALAPVGETHFVQRIADASSTEKIDKTKVSAAIVGFADLLLGDSVEEVLTAHINASPNRFRGIRHACGWDTSVEIRNSHTKPPPQLYLSKLFRKGFRTLQTITLPSILGSITHN